MCSFVSPLCFSSLFLRNAGQVKKLEVLHFMRGVWVLDDVLCCRFAAYYIEKANKALIRKWRNKNESAIKKEVGKN